MKVVFTLKRKRLIAFLILTALVLVFGSAHAQTLDEQLTWNDYFVARQFSMYPRDARYDRYLNGIAQRLNSKIADTFGEDKDITFYVCPSPIGFNAVSFHRFIVFDSLLLDTLRFLAMSKAYYGNIDNAYVNRLVRAVAQKSKAHQMGYIQGNYRNLDNPFGLPKPGNLTLEQQQQAEKLFISMLASWMAHEGSHCMKDHIKFRIQAALKQRQMNFNNQQQFMNNVNQYMNAGITQKLEREADLYATKWLINSGFGVEGYVTWLKFGDKLETVTGANNAYLRTHPKCNTRIRYIIQAARNYSP